MTAAPQANMSGEHLARWRLQNLFEEIEGIDAKIEELRAYQSQRKAILDTIGSALRCPRCRKVTVILKSQSQSSGCSAGSCDGCDRVEIVV